MDINGDGKLSKEEIKIGYKEFFGRNLSNEEVDEMFAKVDIDGSGEIVALRNKFIFICALVSVV